MWTFYFIGTVISFLLTLASIYTKRETIFKENEDLVLATTVVVLTASSWIFPLIVLRKTYQRNKAKRL